MPRSLLLSLVAAVTLAACSKQEAETGAAPAPDTTAPEANAPAPDATVFIDEMRKLGVRIALDDFGAGSSSFGYLKSLAVDYLKIDGQFIKTLTSNALDHAAVRCFRDVAQVLGIRTIAEFVEDEATVTELRRIGVDYAQGYLVHRPEPLETALGLHAPQTA